MSTTKKTAKKESVPADELDEEIMDVDESQENIPFVYSITSYGADYPVDSLVKRMNAKDIVVPAFGRQLSEDGIVGFQREYVWPRPKADRFIESLLLGLPVPGVFLVKEQTGLLLVLDGHQRLFTLRAFYGGVIHGKEYRLQNVDDKFANRTYQELDVEDRRRLDDSIIHATIVRQDEPSDNQSSIYIIFERLNTGGVNLQPQEIRVALYHGEFVRVLRELNEDSNWRNLYGGKSRRLKDMEMILRFFAFFYRSSEYKSPMKEFLNDYMSANRDLTQQNESTLRKLFKGTVSTIVDLIGIEAFRPKGPVNAAVVDSVMTAVAHRIARGPIANKSAFAAKYNALMRSGDYLASVETGTSQETNVANRIKMAYDAFSSCK